jgi:hypothetical protein
MTYVFCPQKKNNPRMDIRICGARCDLKDDCPEYQEAINGCHSPVYKPKKRGRG